MQVFYRFFALLACVIVLSCGKEDEGQAVPTTNQPTPRLIFKFKFDSTQVRLNNLGQTASIPAGHAGQSPDFHGISAHYIEMITTPFTQIGQGEVLFIGPETTAGGPSAIDISQSVIVDEGETFMSFPLSSISPGSYEYIRVSLSYQNYDIEFSSSGIDFTGRLASFVGFNNYISSYKINTQTVALNDDRLQGYWGLEVPVPFSDTIVFTGQAPAGATTVPNPLAGTSAIPAGSCVVTGSFDGDLTITGNETEDIVVTLSLSTNKSFEWLDTNGDGKFQPPGETVVDMGLRGLIAIRED